MTVGTKCRLPRPDEGVRSSTPTNRLPRLPQLSSVYISCSLMAALLGFLSCSRLAVPPVAFRSIPSQPAGSELCVASINNCEDLSEVRSCAARVCERTNIGCFCALTRL